MTHPLKNYQGRVAKLLMLYYTITNDLAISLVLTTLGEQAQINELVHQTVSCWEPHMVWARTTQSYFVFLGSWAQ